MATLRSYVERIPIAYHKRYRSHYWIGWANSLLERLSGQGTIPSQRLTRGVPVYHDVWVSRPPACRDGLELRDSQTQTTAYRFAEENGRMRLLDIRVPVPNESVTAAPPILGVVPNGVVLDNTEAQYGSGEFVKSLFYVTNGTAAGHGYIVAESTAYPAEPPDEPARLVLTFIEPETFAPIDDRDLLPGQVQNIFAVDEAANPPISAGVFFRQGDYLIMYYTAKFRPVTAMSSDMGFDGYENLVESWLRWKIEEQVDTLSQECKYWGTRVEDELFRIRAEASNRINESRGRPLAGLMR